MELTRKTHEIPYGIQNHETLWQTHQKNGFFANEKKVWDGKIFVVQEIDSKTPWNPHGIKKP